MNPADYFKVRARIEKLQELSKQKAPPEHFISNLKFICNGLQLKGGSLDNQYFYRSRPNDPKRYYSHIDELKYPKLDCVKQKGRLNDVQESILYGAMDIVATFIESEEPINRLFTISKIEKVSSIPVPFIPLGILDGVHRQTPRNKTEKVAIEYLNSEIRKYVPIDGDKNAYNSTISLGHLILKSGIVNHESSNLILVYPSAKGIKGGSSTTYNIAMTPEMFDKNYKIKETSVYCITNHPDRYILNEINKGSINANGSINWKYSHEEMIVRIGKGLLIDESINVEITNTLRQIR